MTQVERLLELFGRGESITTLESYNQLGITRLASRINDIKKLGYDIRDEFIEVTNRYDETCHIKRYWLNHPEVSVFTQAQWNTPVQEQDLFNNEIMVSH